MTDERIAYETQDEAQPRALAAMPGAAANARTQDLRPSTSSSAQPEGAPARPAASGTGATASRLAPRAPWQARRRHPRSAARTTMLHTLAVLVATYVVSFAVAASAVAPQKARATGEGEKVKTPVVSDYVAQRENSVWGNVIDASQGRDIPFRVAGTMPVDLAERSTLAYWIVAEYEDGFDLDEDSPKVELVHADGTTRDVTNLLTLRHEDRTIVAGSANIIRAISGLTESDRLTLSYVARLNERSHLGLTRGNASYAHIEYSDENAISSQVEAGASGRGARQAQVLTTTSTTRLAMADGSTSAAGAARTDVARGSVRRAGTHLVPASLGGSNALAAGMLNAAGRASVRLAAQNEVRAPGLTWSPEIKAVVYTYQIDVVVTAKNTGSSLAGARFALQDDSGLWYVAGKDWTPRQEEATAMATDDSGRASFRNVGSGTYHLVELSAPHGFVVADPVSVVVQAEASADAEMSLHASSIAAQSVEADARSGIITVAVQNAPTNGGNDGGTGDDAHNDGTTGGNGRNTSRSDYDVTLPRTGTEQTGSNVRSPQTGDIVAPVLEVALIAALVILCGVLLRRGAAGSQDDSR